MSFLLVPKSVTLNDLEWRNGRYFALFHIEIVSEALSFWSKYVASKSIFGCKSKNVTTVKLRNSNRHTGISEMAVYTNYAHSCLFALVVIANKLLVLTTNDKSCWYNQWYNFQ